MAFLARFLRFCAVLATGLGIIFPAAAELVSVRLAGDGAPTRVTVETTLEEAADAFLTDRADGSRAVIVRLAEADLPQTGKGTGGVTRWQAEGQSLIFVLDRPMTVARILRLPPSGSAKNHRLILDLEEVSPARFSVRARKDAKRFAKISEPVVQDAALAGAAEPVKPVRKPLFGAKGKPKTFTIVIDPGHGGKDPGALALAGGKEKDITLAAAKTLKSLLESDARYTVHLTRDDDTYVELEDRVTRARDWGADLFISLHADAAGSASVAGASVYTISARGEKRVDKEAGRNKWTIPKEDGTTEEVSGILEDLVKRETKTRSAEFAEALLPELGKAGPVLRGTHRNAGFYVLLAPDVPAVLLEMGFLTNKEDAERLKSASGRKASMNAVRKGIDTFFDKQEVRFASN